MWKLAAITFFATTIICAYKWIGAKVALDILVEYAKRQGYIPPSENELRECTEYVYSCILKKIFKKYNL